MVAPTGAPDELPIDVDLIKVLASDTRRDLLRLLGERRHTLTELAEAVGLKKATILEHLQKLVAADLIRRVDGDARLWVYYELTPRGKRLVRPERTRFYLILGGTAAAAVILGAILAAAMLSGTGNVPSSDDPTSDASSSSSLFDDRSSAGLPPVVWRGLDANVVLPLPGAPSNATLALRAQTGETVTLPITEEQATLRAEIIDKLAPGRYTLSLRSSAGEAPLFETLTVQDPTIAIFPLALPAHATSSLELSLAPPNFAPPTGVLLSYAGQELAADGVPLRVGVTTNATDGALRVGRLHATTLVVLPDLAATVARNGTQMEIRAFAAGVPLSNARVLLDGAALGRTNDTGVLVAPWPDAGERVLRLDAPDGATVERGLRFTAEGASDMAPALRLEAFDARGPMLTGLRARAEIFNDGPALELVTVAARQHGALLASVLVRVPAHASAQVLLESPLAAPEVIDITAHAARGQSMTAGLQMDADAARTSHAAAGASPENAAATPAAPMPAPAGATMARDAFAAYSAADASDTLYYASPTSSPVASTPGSQEDATPRAPMASLVAVLAVLAIAALVRRRER